MTPLRRRTRSGIPLAVVIAILTAIFASRMSRAPDPAAASGIPVPVSLPRPEQDTRTGSPTDASAATTVGTSAVARRDSPGFTSRQRLREHYDKHGEEFPGLSIEAYLLAAQALRDAPVGGSALEVRRRDGVVTRFDRTSGAFLAANRDGTIRTFFRPNDGEAYFRRQASRTPGGGP
ncbi:MAG: hypothetical protein U5K74_16195 [Gemmatimonadaceae bacterium]|nr:hypothetical protein [Gemmatimonadaceae bacterium]